MPACNRYRPHPKDAAFCGACNHSWNAHANGVRHLFWDQSDKFDIDKLISACKRDTDSPCKHYTPVRNWDDGAAPDCVCGRPVRPSHLPGDILDGIRKWREAHPVPTPVCKRFIGSISTPGTCSMCKEKWIQHTLAARGQAIEAFYDEHEHGCKCIMMNGDVPCSCMTDQEKQNTLDDLGYVKRSKETATTMGCKEFKPKSVGNTYCTCGAAFHLHSLVACDGHVLFLNWRAAHLTNKELLTWFMILPGKTRDDRVQILKRILTDPNYVWVPPANMVNPDNFTLCALFDTLTGGHLVMSPKDIEKRDGKMDDGSAIVPPSDEEEPGDVVATLYFCHGCQSTTSLINGQLCEECTAALEAASQHA